MSVLSPAPNPIETQNRYRIWQSKEIPVPVVSVFLLAPAKSREKVARWNINRPRKNICMWKKVYYYCLHHNLAELFGCVAPKGVWLKSNLRHRIANCEFQFGPTKKYKLKSVSPNECTYFHIRKVESYNSIITASERARQKKNNHRVSVHHGERSGSSPGLSSSSIVKSCFVIFVSFGCSVCLSGCREGWISVRWFWFSGVPITLAKSGNCRLRYLT